MTLNFACRPTIFPANPSEDNLVSSIGITNRYVVEGNPERNGDGFGKPRRFNWEIEDSYDYRRDRDDWGDSRETISNDILDILPSDPFGMDISATFTAITGWIEDLEADSESFGRDEVGAMKADYQFVAGFNFFWNKAMRFQAEPGFMEINERSNPVGRFDECVEDMELGEGSYDGAFVSACNEDDDDSRVSNLQAKEPWEGTENSLARNGENPHEALFFALSYLGVQDLLSVERVCKSLHSAVQNDTLVWRSIHIDHPLSERIADDALLQLTNRAQGSLHCLSLVDCSRITDDGLKHVLESNPKLVKLSVPRCTRLSVEGIVNNLKAFKSSGAPGIKHLRIGGLYGVTNHHFDELKLLLGTESCLHPKPYKPRFYHIGRSSFSCDDDRAIDIENCPKCQNLRLVYDCPAESCQGKQAASQLCRACILCIARCVHCGRCINNGEYEETFCLDLLCLDCWKQHSIFHQKTRYHFRLYG